MYVKSTIFFFQIHNSIDIKSTQIPELARSQQPMRVVEDNLTYRVAGQNVG